MNSYSKPSRLVVLAALSVFIAEVAVMFVLAALPSMSVRVEALVDGVFLTILILPLLYLFHFRPLNRQISVREEAERDLRHMNERLEGIVDERTGELQEKNEELRLEVIERKQSEMESHKNKDFLLRVLETNPYLVLIFDIERSRCIYANSRTTDMLGYAPEELYLMGSEFQPKVMDFKDFETSPCGGGMLDEALDGDVLQSEVWMTETSGERNLFDCSMVVFARSEDHSPKSLLCTITHRRWRE